MATSVCGVRPWCDLTPAFGVVVDWSTRSILMQTNSAHIGDRLGPSTCCGRSPVSNVCADEVATVPTIPGVSYASHLKSSLGLNPESGILIAPSNWSSTLNPAAVRLDLFRREAGAGPTHLKGGVTTLNKKWRIALVVLFLLLIVWLFRGCSTEDTALGPAQADPDAAEWVGTVVGTDLSYKDEPQVKVDFGDSTTQITVARIHAPNCGGQKAAAKEALRQRLGDLLPAGTAVRVVRAVQHRGLGGSLGVDLLSTSSGYVFTENPIVTPPATLSLTTSAVRSSTTTRATATPTTTTSSPAATPTSNIQVVAPASGSVNEALLAEGYADLDPLVDLSVAATDSIDEQIDQADYEVGGDRQWFTHLLAANQSAWDASRGSQAACRIADQPRVEEKKRQDEEKARREAEAERARQEWQAAEARRRAQQERLNELKAGPDGQLNTADDDHTNYAFDGEGSIYVVPAPTYSSGGSGGGGGGGGGFCRRSRWC